MAVDQGRCDLCQEVTINGRCRNRECRRFRDRRKVHMLVGGRQIATQLLSVLVPTGGRESELAGIIPGGSTVTEIEATAAEMHDDSDATWDGMTVDAAGGNTFPALTVRWQFTPFSGTATIAFLRLRSRVVRTGSGSMQFKWTVGALTVPSGPPLDYPISPEYLEHEQATDPSGDVWTPDSINELALGSGMNNMFGSSQTGLVFSGDAAEFHMPRFLIEVWGVPR